MQESTARLVRQKILKDIIIDSRFIDTKTDRTFDLTVNNANKLIRI